MAYAPTVAHVATPIGTVILSADGDTLTSLIIDPEFEATLPPPKSGILADAALQVAQYFDGALKRFDLKLFPAKTRRGEELRAAIASVPYGESETYGDIAARIASSSRAMGQACAQNPFPIIIPCHRVLSGAGKEHYSAGNGVDTKHWLLAHEARHSGKILL
jgi:methylated-DNA-[protein]-cysteine S-methyltransferase